MNFRVLKLGWILRAIFLLETLSTSTHAEDMPITRCHSCFYSTIKKNGTPNSEEEWEVWALGEARINEDDVWRVKHKTEKCMGDADGKLDDSMLADCTDYRISYYCSVIYARNNFGEYAVLRRCGKSDFAPNIPKRNLTKQCLDYGSYDEAQYNNIIVKKSECACRSNSKKPNGRNPGCNDDKDKITGPNKDSFKKPEPGEVPDYKYKEPTRPTEATTIGSTTWAPPTTKNPDGPLFCYTCWHSSTNDAEIWKNWRTGFIEAGYFKREHVQQSTNIKIRNSNEKILMKEECKGNDQGEITDTSLIKKCSHIYTLKGCIRIHAVDNAGNTFVMRRCPDKDLDTVIREKCWKRDNGYNNIKIKSELCSCLTGDKCNDDKKYKKPEPFKDKITNPEYSDPTIANTCYNCWYDTTASKGSDWTRFFPHFPRSWNFSYSLKWEGCAPKDDGRSDSELWNDEDHVADDYVSKCSYNGPGACMKDFARNHKGEYFAIRRCATWEDEKRFHLDLNRDVGRMCLEGNTLERKNFEHGGRDPNHNPSNEGAVYVSCISAKSKSNDNSDGLTIPRYPNFLTTQSPDSNKEKAQPNDHTAQLVILPLIIVLVTVILIMIDCFEGRIPYFEK